jgi:hypothetical protein
MLRAARFVAVAAVAAATVLPLKAAVIAAPTFEEMVKEARQIILAETLATQASWRSSSQGRFIETTVTFKVDGVIKGPFVREQTLKFMGGEVGDIGMGVSDMVRFTKGDRDVLFVAEATNPLNALVGFNQGRFKLTGENIVLTHEGQPLGIEGRRGSPSLLATPLSQGVSLNSFIAHIRTTADTAGVSLR